MEASKQHPERWITVATFDDSAAAHLARLKLETEDIDSVLLDENIVSMNWLYGIAVGGIKMQVPQSVAAQAAELLTRFRPQTSTEPLYDGQERCPSCGSDSIYPSRLSRKVFFLSILFLGVPLPFLSRRMRCAACGFEWKPRHHDAKQAHQSETE